MHMYGFPGPVTDGRSKNNYCVRMYELENEEEKGFGSFLFRYYRWEDFGSVFKSVNANKLDSSTFYIISSVEHALVMSIAA